MRQWNARERGHGDRGSHSRDHFEGDARRHQSFGLFSAAPEDKRVTALKPHHSPSGARMFDQDLVYFSLFDAPFGTAFFAGENALGAGGRQPQNFGTHQ